MGLPCVVCELMVSLNPKFSLHGYGSKNVYARTDNVFNLLARVNTRAVTLSVKEFGIKEKKEGSG